MVVVYTLLSSGIQMILVLGVDVDAEEHQLGWMSYVADNGMGSGSTFW